MKKFGKFLFSAVILTTPIALTLTALKLQKEQEEMQVVPLEPQVHAQLLYHEAEALSLKGQHELAISKLQRASQLQLPATRFYAKLHLRLGQLLMEEGNKEAAIVALEEAASSQQSDDRLKALALKAMSDLHAQNNEWRLSARALYEALEGNFIYPTLSAHLLYDLSKAQMHLGEDFVAIETLCRAKKLTHEDFHLSAQIYTLLGLTYAQVNAWDDAKEAFDEALAYDVSLQPEVAKGIETLEARRAIAFTESADRHLSENEKQFALADYMRALSIPLAPGDLQAYLHLQVADIFWEANNHEEAFTHYHACIDSPKADQALRGAAQLNLGIAYASIGMIAEGHDALTSSLDNLPQESEMYSKARSYTNNLAEQLFSHLSALGIKEIDSGDFVSAEKHLGKALSLKSINNHSRSSVWSHLAQAQEKLGHTHLAIDSLRAALALNPTDSTLKSTITSSLARLYDRAGNFDESIKFYSQALTFTPELKSEMQSVLTRKAENLVEQGMHHLDRRETKLALQAFEKGLSIDTNSPIARARLNYGLARVYEEKGLSDLAFDHIQRALDENVSNKELISEFNFAKAMQLSTRGRYDQAINALKNALECENALLRAKSHHELAKLYIRGNAPKLAVEELHAIFDAECGNQELEARTDLLLGQIYQRAGKLDQAISYYSRAVSRDNVPESLQAKMWTRLGNAFRMHGESAKAIHAYETGLKIARNAPNIKAHLYNNLGICNFKEGNAQEAMAAYYKALALKKVDNKLKARIYYNLGFALKASGKVDAMISTYERGLALAQEDQKMREQLEIALKDGMKVRDAMQ